MNTDLRFLLIIITVGHVRNFLRDLFVFYEDFPMKTAALIAALTIAAGSAHAASVTLYDQDFEKPDGFVNGAGSGYSDLSQQSVNSLYGNQPAGFEFQQAFTVETMLLTGTEAFDTGYKDTTGQGGNYAVGMLGTFQNDKLGLNFNVDDFDFFNFKLDVSSVGLHSGPFAPFTKETDVPQFAFTLFDNPSGVPSTGSGSILDQGELLGTASALDTLDWTTGTFAFDTSKSTNGNVTLQIDLLSNGYAVFDNFLITASDTAGGGLDPVPSVPLPAGLPLLLAGLGFLGVAAKRRRS